jgi:hypothetical protein
VVALQKIKSRSEKHRENAGWATVKKKEVGSKSESAVRACRPLLSENPEAA